MSTSFHMLVMLRLTKKVWPCMCFGLMVIHTGVGFGDELAVRLDDTLRRFGLVVFFFSLVRLETCMLLFL
jgi:hypothetical protein